jgi:hypothetical protein
VNERMSSGLNSSKVAECGWGGLGVLDVAIVPDGLALTRSPACTKKHN